LQFSRALGLETWAVTGQPNKTAELKSMGAHEVLSGGKEPGIAMRDAGGFDIILSTTNSAAQISSAFAGLREGGRMVNMGVADGPIAINPIVLMMGQRQLRGSSQDERLDLIEALELTAAGKVKPMLEVYPLTQANEVRARLEAGLVRYRAVLTHT
jgi:D-arabinose 1-dehydrogenase-like Zn-dependent alcohol dehydrogenase